MRPGNNGGDGFVVARHLHVAGVAAGVCIDAAARELDTGREHDARGGDRVRRARARAGGCRRDRRRALRQRLPRALEGAAEALVTRANALAAQIVALDVPSGVDGASGRVEGVAIRAVLTLAFHGRTLGTAIEPGRGCSGEVVELPIGLPIALAGPQRAVRLERSDLALVPQRSPTGSKYDAGGVLVVGGSPGMSGGSGARRAGGACAAVRGSCGSACPASEHAAVAPIPRS